jgi:WD40 repeat protein
VGFFLRTLELFECSITSLAVHPTQRLCVCGGEDGGIKIVNFDNGKVVAHWEEAHAESVESLLFSPVFPNLPSLKLVCSGSVDGKIKIFDLNTATQRLTLSHDDAVTSIVFHPSEPLIFSSSVDRTVRVWDVRSGEEVQKFRGHQDNVLQVAIDTRE